MPYYFPNMSLMKRPSSDSSRTVLKRPSSGSVEQNVSPKSKKVLKASSSVSVNEMGGFVPSATAVVETSDGHEDPEATRRGWPAWRIPHGAPSQGSQVVELVASDSDATEVGGEVTL